jgi:hypothetical protein
MLLVAMVWYMFLTLLLLGVYEVVNVRHENRHRFSDLWEACIYYAHACMQPRIQVLRWPRKFLCFDVATRPEV